MNAAVIVVLVVVALIVVAVVAFISMYNRFARQRNSVEESWRQIDVELQRRHDLIGNLVEVTAAAARFEQETLARVVRARSEAVAAHGAGPAAQGQAEQRLNGALANFFAVAEQYPNLRANQQFGHLQQQLVETEDRIAGRRRVHNDAVRAFNTRFDTFPSSVVANVGGFRKKEYYEVDDPRVRAAPSLRGAFDGLDEQVTPTPPIGRPAIRPPVSASTPTAPVRARPAQPHPGGTMSSRDESRAMPDEPPQTPPAPPVPDPAGEPPTGGPMPDDPPQTPPAPPVQPPRD